jgi:hypothetical protein
MLKLSDHKIIYQQSINSKINLCILC